MARNLVPLVLAGLLAVGGAATTGCRTVPATGERAFILLSWEEEIALGKEAAPKMEQEYGGRIENMALQSYVRSVGSRVAASSDMPDLPYQFAALRSDMVNAFALPGGPVYVTRGLLEGMESEGELAAVLGHEIAHVNARHSAKMVSRQMAAQVVLAAASAAAGDGGGQGAETAKQLAKVVGALVSLKYSRDMEREADRIGLDYMAAAGYEPDAMVGLLRIFTEMEAEGRPPEFLSTHPNPENRIGRMSELIEEKYPDREGRVAGREYREQVLRRLD